MLQTTPDTPGTQTGVLADHRIAEPPLRAAQRDARVDVLRGFALLTIFIDHIPNNIPARFTLHNLGFSDAAEIFVLLAGYSAMAAYGRLFRRDGARVAIGKIARRCLKIYLFQAGLLIATLVLVRIWMNQTGIVPRLGVGPLLQMGFLRGMFEGLRLNALPNYIDILPLYIVLLALFPLVYAGLRRSVWLTVAVSGAVWLVANLDHRLNLPNAAVTDDSGWYFNPFAWQFLFVIGAALSIAVSAWDGLLPRWNWLVAACWVFLAFAFFEAAPWPGWGLPDLRPLDMAQPEKSRVAFLRILHILAVSYLLFGSVRVHALARRPWLGPIEACGRHSLEIFAVGCICALSGRMLYRTFGPDWPLQVAVNLVGLLAMLGVAHLFERRRLRRLA